MASNQKKKLTSIVLAGDVGGTKVWLRLDRWKSGKPRAVAERLYKSEDYSDLSEILKEFLKENREPIESVCLAVAGPIVKQSAKLTNLPWKISARAIASSFKIPKVALINDFEAVGWGIQALSPRELLTLQGGKRQSDAMRVVLGAGTGLGVCFVGMSPQGPAVYASEGGHASFAPQGEEQIKLLQFLSERYGRVSVERALSGSGLTNIFQFLNETRPACCNLLSEMEEGDPAAVITKYALENRDPLARKALDLFVSMYGAFAGDLALLAMARGGVYIAGGIAPKIRAKLREGIFVRAFCDKGRYSALLKTIPIRVVLNEKVGLLGASWYAYQRTED
ncbi:MAG: glucokinase [Burkholderiales bacterium]